MNELSEFLMKNQDEILDIIRRLAISATTKPSLRDKLKSRKFIISMLGVICAFIGVMLNAGESVSVTIVCAIVNGMAVGVYTFMEGRVDVIRKEELTSTLNTILGMLSEEKQLEQKENETENFQESMNILM